MTNAAEPRPDETHLPGGTIGRPRTFDDRTGSWTRTAESGLAHVPDSELKRTSLRWADGWYLVTSSPGENTATWRRGPFVECAKAEDALLNLAAGIAEEETGTGGEPTSDTTPRPEGGETDNTEDIHAFDHLDLPNTTYERVAQICNEGQAKRLYDACQRWLREVTRHGNDPDGRNRVPTPAHCENLGLGASGSSSPAQARQTHDDMLAAAREYENWLEI